MTRSSHGTIPAGLTLYTFFFDDGEDLDRFHESDAVARNRAALEANEDIVRVVNVLSGAIVYERGEKRK
jgi:hypothetical protein